MRERDGVLLHRDVELAVIVFRDLELGFALVKIDRGERCAR